MADCSAQTLSAEDAAGARGRDAVHAPGPQREEEGEAVLQEAPARDSAVTCVVFE